MIPQRMKLQSGSRGVLLSLRKILIGGVLIAMLTVGGCATYHPMPPRHFKTGWEHPI